LKLLVWPDRLMKTQIIEKDIIINIRGEYEEGRLLITVDDTSRNYDIQVIGEDPSDVIFKRGDIPQQE
jgi:hypothetical protein